MKRDPKGKQAKIYQFIRDYWSEHNYAPSLKEIGGGVGITLPTVVRYHLRHLRSQGSITFMDGKARTVRLVGPVAEE